MDYRYLDRLAGAQSRTRPVGEHPLCAFCGYDLFGGVSDCCPECGHLIDSQAMRDQSDEVKAQVVEFEEALRFLPLAWKLVTLGAILFLIRIPPFLGPGALWLARSMGFLCGFVALFLRLSVIRSGKLPPAAITQEQRAARDSFLAAIEIVGGLFIMGTSIGLK
jgi:hypothetical protein